MSEIRAELKNIRNVQLKAQVISVKDSDPKVVTAVRFYYDGEPSEMESILLAEAQNQPVNADIYSPQMVLSLDGADGKCTGRQARESTIEADEVEENAEEAGAAEVEELPAARESLIKFQTEIIKAQAQEEIQAANEREAASQKFTRSVRCTGCQETKTMEFTLDREDTTSHHWKGKCPKCKTENSVKNLRWDGMVGIEAEKKE